MTATKIVRVNGVPFAVPEDELTDPHPNAEEGSWCSAYEPAIYGDAMCTIRPHGAGAVHIAHDGERNVIAIWGGQAEESGDVEA